MTKLLLCALVLIGFPASLQAEWDVRLGKDAMTDAVQATASLKGEGGRLVFQCSGQSKKGVILFRPDSYLGGPIGSHKGGDVWLRFDDAPATVVRWWYEHDFVASESEADVADLVPRIVAAKRMAVRVRRYDDALIDGVFEVEGAREALIKAMTACVG